MPRPRSLPDVTELKKLLEQGLTHRQIADAHGVTEQAVSSHVRLHDLAPAPARYPDAVPWFVKKEHRGPYTLRMLRLYGKKQSGRELRPGESAALERFMDRLDQAGDVVGYDVEVGFYFTPRRKGVDRGMIREPKA